MTLFFIETLDPNPSVIGKIAEVFFQLFISSLSSILFTLMTLNFGSSEQNEASVLGELLASVSKCMILWHQPSMKMVKKRRTMSDDESHRSGWFFQFFLQYLTHSLATKICNRYYMPWIHWKILHVFSLNYPSDSEVSWSIQTYFFCFHFL